MGSGASTADIQQQLKTASKDEIAAAVAAMPAEDQAKLAAAVSKPLTYVAAIQATLDRIKAKDPELNACVEVLDQYALKLAAEADARAPESRRPLEGEPILVKANIDLAGSLTTNAMKGMADFRPESTATMVAKLLEAGAIPVAKTTMPEAAFGLWGWSKLHGLTKNPLNTKYAAGGSSTGSAVGIAAGYATMGLGSDTEGSCRGPAAFCGVCGFRPSLQRYPEDGVAPCNIAHDTAGPMASTMAGIAKLDAVITGVDPTSYAPASLASLSVAVASDWDDNLHAAQKASIDQVISVLEAAGATVKRGVAFKPVQAGVEGFKEISYRMEGFKNYCKSHKNLSKTPEEILEESFYPNVKNFFLDPKSAAGPMVNISNFEGEERAELVKKNEEGMAAWEAKYEEFFKENSADILLCPSLIGTPPLVQDDYSDFVSTIMKYIVPYGAYQGVNGLKVPSLVLPTPAAKIEDVEGGALPTSVLIYGKGNTDKVLIEIGMALEAALRKT